jgi:cation transport regulator
MVIFKMPYHSISDLPSKIKNVLPKHAQEIYVKAFNNAVDEYKDPSKRKKKGSNEETAHRVAWSAVKMRYKKANTGEWVEK